MIVRPATLEDWFALSSFIEAMNRERVTKYDEPDMTRLHLEVVHHAIEREFGGVYIAEDERGSAIGFTAMVSFPEMPKGYVEGVGTYVLPEYRRTKVAHELGVAAREFHRERGGEYVYGTVNHRNEPSLKRCLAEGAEVIGVQLRYALDRSAVKSDIRRGLDGLENMPFWG